MSPYPEEILVAVLATQDTVVAILASLNFAAGLEDKIGMSMGGAMESGGRCVPFHP